MRHWIWPALMLSLLAGCADAPKKEALIEDRGVKAEAKAADPAKTADAKAAPEKAAEVRPADSKTTETKPSPARKEDPLAPKVQTQALAAQVAEVKPLQTQSGGAQVPASLPPLRDPANLLSKRRLQFEYDSAAIREEYTSVLEAHAKYLKGNKTANVILQGHADERGSREYNLALGQRRAEGVHKALQLLGVPDAQVEAVSLGEEKPLAEGHDENAWTQNRRVELLYQGE